MKRRGILILITATAACAPSYKSGKTQCSDKKECPSGFSCSDDGTSGIHYCIDNKLPVPGCPAGSTFYCSQSNTCWPRPGACSTVTKCETAKHQGYVICALPNYHPDCNGDSCLPNPTVADASPGSGGRDGGADGVTGKGGSTVPITGYGGIIGYGGIRGYGGSAGAGGRDAGPEVGPSGTGGMRDAGPEVPGLGGYYLTGGTSARGGTFGTGGFYLTGGTSGRGGTSGSGGFYLTGGISGIRGSGGYFTVGGSTGSSFYCSGTPYTCDSLTTAGAADCGLDNGCVWNSSSATCGGTAMACSSYGSSTWCIYNGCSWSGPFTCSATTMTATCASYISSSSSACDLCTYSSCCGQITDCVNDPGCLSNLSGPTWQRYVDCLINCCGGASACNWY